MTTTIVCIDPGQTTGAAVFEDRELRTTMQFETWKNLGILLSVTTPDVIVYETFTPQAVSTDPKTYAPIGVIEVLRYLSESKPWRLVAQQPMQKQFWSDKKLQQLGLYTTGPHARDAIRHGLYYISFMLGDQRYLKQLAK